MNKIVDKLVLIGTGLVVVGCLLGGLLVLDHQYHASKNLQIYMLFAIGYVAIVVNGCISTIKKQQKRVLAIAILIVVLLLVVMTFSALFYFNVISFPNRNIWPWGIGITLLAMITILGYAKLVGMLVTKNKISINM